MALHLLTRIASAIGLGRKTKTASAPKPKEPTRYTREELRDLQDRYDISPMPIEEGDPPGLRRLAGLSDRPT